MKVRPCSSAVIAIMLFVFSTGANAALIDTTGSWNGSNAVGPFGERYTATYGQTITTGPMTVLESFTFFLNDRFFGDFVDFVDFEALVFAWDGTKAIGVPLFQSAAMSTTNNGGSDGFEEITISTGGIALAAASQYVLALTTSNLFDGLWGRSDIGCLAVGCFSGDSYAGGNFVYLSNENVFAELTTRTWSQRDGDLAFIASIDEKRLPVPGSLALLGLGLAGLVCLGRPSA